MLYLSLFLGGFMLVSLVSFFLAIRPPRIEGGAKPESFSLRAEEIILTAPDGTALSAWWIPGETKRTVIFLHGYPADKSDMLSLAAPFAPTFSLLLLDLRYFGNSGGAFTTLGLKERRDIKVALDFLKERGAEHIGVFGFSLGGATAILAAAEDSRIEAVATYAAFSRHRRIAHEAYRTLGPLKYPLVFFMELWAAILFGASPTSAAPEDALRGLTIPVLVIHGREDEQISFLHAEQLK
ncbi:MAG: alpha/beta fold hydrolase, partial [bacterium]|nr:alpha/beta fold hydrolase [bacterium]